MVTVDAVQVRRSDLIVKDTRIHAILTIIFADLHRVFWTNLTHAEVAEDLVQTATTLSYTKLKTIRALQFARSNNERAQQK